MALITRLSRLLRADLHALLDRLEEPDILLAQALREMEAQIANQARQLSTLEQSRGRLQDRRQALSAEAADHADSLDACLDAGQDDLARQLLRRRLEQARLDGLLAQRAAELERRIDAAAETLANHRRRLEQLRAEAAMAVASQTDNQAPATEQQDGTALWPDWTGACPAPVQAADVEAALLAEKQRRSA